MALACSASGAGATAFLVLLATATRAGLVAAHFGLRVTNRDALGGMSRVKEPATLLATKERAFVVQMLALLVGVARAELDPALVIAGLAILRRQDFQSKPR